MATAYAELKAKEATDDVTDFCDHAVVKVKSPWGLVLFIVNIFLPGIGTIISSFMDSSVLGRSKLNGLALLFGVLQFVFCLTIICWIWSIWHGYQIWQKSKRLF